MKLLALDPASITGWCVGDTGGLKGVVAGSQRLRRSEEGFDQAVWNATAWMESMILAHRPSFVVVENWILPQGGRTTANVTMFAGAFHVALRSACAHADIPFAGVSVDEWRKFFCGCARAPMPKGASAGQKRAANKKMVLTEGVSLGILPLRWRDTDASDAVGIWCWGACRFGGMSMPTDLMGRCA